MTLCKLYRSQVSGFAILPFCSAFCSELAEIESASWCALLGGFCRSSACAGSVSMGAFVLCHRRDASRRFVHADRGEVGYRLGRLLYRVIAFCVLALSITGGHIAHVHGRAVLYFVGLWPHVPKGSNQWLVINKDASNPDEKYWLSAAVDLAILAAIIFFFIWAEKSLRRARKQRRSESVEEPDDVESGARSPQ